MNNPITLEMGIGLVLVFISVGGVWLRSRMAVVKCSNDLSEYKLEVAEKLKQIELDAINKYASVGHLQEVELRLVKSIDGLSKRIDKLIHIMTDNATKKQST